MNTRSRKNKNLTNQNEFQIKNETRELFIKLEDSEQETDTTNHVPLSPKKKNTKNKNKKSEKGKKTKNKNLLSNKHKLNSDEDVEVNKDEENDAKVHKNLKQKKINEFSFIPPQGLKKPCVLRDSKNIKQRDDSQINEEDNKDIKNEENNEEEVIDFPYEFTQRIIEALTCSFCQGIYIRPYVIDERECGHIFCLGCLLKMLGNNGIGKCFICNFQFNDYIIKYSEITDYYVNTFFPQIPNIINENVNELNQFMENESKKYSNMITTTNMALIFELKPFKENIPPQNRLPEMIRRHNKFKFNIKSEDEDIISIVKKEIIKQLNLTLKEEEIELRVQGVEVSNFKTFKLLKSYLPSNLEEIFYYSKRGKNTI